MNEAHLWPALSDRAFFSRAQTFAGDHTGPFTCTARSKRIFLPPGIAPNHCRTHTAASDPDLANHRASIFGQRFLCCREDTNVVHFGLNEFVDFTFSVRIGEYLFHAHEKGHGILLEL
jgi:hypothetical protein